MTTVFWSCLLGGLGVSALLFVADGLLDGLLDGLDLPDGLPLDPLSLVVGATFFGAAGIVLTETGGLGPAGASVPAAAIGLGAAAALHALYVAPMKRSESSGGFSEREYAGKIGEVNTAIPAQGYGEVLVKMGGATTFRTARSFSDAAIPTGTAVVVVELDGEGTLLVEPLEDEAAEGSAPRLAA